jgi:hypothetical protein
MKKILALAILTLITGMTVSAQAIVGRLTGTPVIANVKNDTEGSPYLYPDFSSGMFLLNDNKTVVRDLQIRFDVLKGIVTYKDDHGAELVPTSPVKQFVIEKDGKQRFFRLGFPAIDEYTSNTYYELLSKEGSPMILRKPVKNLLSRREYNSSKVTDTYLNAEKYFVYTEAGEMVKYKSDKKSIASYFPSKIAEINTFIESNKINLKNADDLAKLFNYYLSIKGQ